MLFIANLTKPKDDNVSYRHGRKAAAIIGLSGTVLTVLTVLTTDPAVAGEQPPGAADPPADAVYSLSLVATRAIRGSGRTMISGSYMPGTGVDIYARPSGAADYSFLGSLDTDDVNGAYSGSFPIRKSTLFQARSAGLVSPIGRTLVYSEVTLTATSKTRGRATLSALGAPSAEGTLTFYRSVAGQDPVLISMTSDAKGNGRRTITLPEGRRSVYVVYKAPGTGAAISETVPVTVK